MSYGDILIIGGESSIGSRLAELYTSFGVNTFTTTRNINKTTYNNVFLDLSSDVANWKIPSPNIKIVFFCASVTNINFCEANQDYSELVNVKSTLRIVEKMAIYGAHIIFFSSSTVFDGTFPYAKTIDKTHPLSVYGKQKELVEKEVIKLGDAATIIRASKILSKKTNLFTNWVEELEKGNKIEAYHDMYFSPISMDFFIETLFKINQMRLSDIIQISAIDQISYLDAITFIAKKKYIDEHLIVPKSCKNNDNYSLLKYTTLDCTRLINLGYILPSSYESLNQFIN
jgi:dTDP-4-dehydrorhamnose reductase